MSQKYDKLKTLLKELFQLDQPDLDFGLYRIMHAKSAEVTQFLEDDLLPQVKQAFGLYKTADKSELEKELAKAIEQAEALGADPESLPKVKELRSKIANDSVDLGALESEVYDHLYSFFRRYYSDGDFLARRVYKPGVYAIPYEGEEVTLYWANRDQYYIKTTEYLRDYAFRLRPNDPDPMRVHFRLVDAAEGEHGNVKAAEGKERVFILAAAGESGNDFLSLSEGEQGPELGIAFEYRPATLADWPESARKGKTKPPAQKDLASLATEQILGVSSPEIHVWIAELARAHVNASGEVADYSRLQAHLRRYVARNTCDYFIHKDLGGFLRRELDFYVKNEVMHLDDIQDESAPRVEQYLSKIKVIRRIAEKIITFLAQLEDFQKKLWLKKKFVVETNYCIALNHIPAELYPDIVANTAQIDEWISLLGIDNSVSLFAPVAYSTPLTIDFIKQFPGLLVDTRFFSPHIVQRMVSSLPNLEELVSGILIDSENFQALSLIQRRFKDRINSTYIDPPYNTDASSIDYKNGYKNSSWMSLIQNRLDLAKPMMSSDGVMIAAIDDEQQRELAFLMSETFDDRILGTFCVRSNPSGRPQQTGYSVSHEYLIYGGRTADSRIGRMPPTDEQLSRFSQKDEEGIFEWRNLRREGSGSDRDDRRTMYYPIYINPAAGTIRVPAMEWDETQESWCIKESPLKTEQTIWPNNEDGREKRWRWEYKTVMERNHELTIRKDRTGQSYVYAKRRPHDEGVVSVSSWFDAKYSATEHGTALLKDLFGNSPFSYPKSIYAVEDAIYIGGANKLGAWVLDYFAGSGTTGHAVINLNRRNGGTRKFVLVEAGRHFSTVILPRIKKVTFTSSWSGGKPLALATAEDVELGPKVLKVLRLESYEDTLNNLELLRTADQQRLLSDIEAQGVGGLREQYTLGYMLDVESGQSQSLLNTRAFQDPTQYKLRVRRPGSDESRETNVDLLETFNWLIGLSVQHVAVPMTLAAEFIRDEEKRLRVKGRIRQDDAGPWWFRSVTGTTPDGRKTLIIWRKLTGDPEADNLVLDEWFTRQGYSTKDYEFQLIYANGDNNLENLKAPDDTWKVRLIEEDFHRLMFDTEGL